MWDTCSLPIILHDLKRIMESCIDQERLSFKWIHGVTYTGLVDRARPCYSLPVPAPSISHTR